MAAKLINKGLSVTDHLWILVKLEWKRSLFFFTEDHCFQTRFYRAVHLTDNVNIHKFPWSVACVGWFFTVLLEETCVIHSQQNNIFDVAENLQGKGNLHQRLRHSPPPSGLSPLTPPEGTVSIVWVCTVIRHSSLMVRLFETPLPALSLAWSRSDHSVDSS